LKAGGTVTQETRGWDEAKQETFLQRSKESAHDYRYFPEPDLPPLDVAHIREELKHHLPELPAQKRSRFKEQYGLDGEAIELFVRDKKMAEFFEETVSELQEWLASDGKATKPRDAYKLVRNYMLSDLSRALDEKGVALDDMKVDPKNFAELITLVAEKKISSRGAKDLLSHMVKLGGDPHEIAKDKDLFQTSDSGELEAIVKKVIENNASAVAEYKAGKQNALQFLVGQAMKVSKGKGDPEVIRRLLINELSW